MFLSPHPTLSGAPRQREPSDSINSTANLTSFIQANLHSRIIKCALTLASLCRGRWIFPCIYTRKKTEGEFETFFQIIKGSSKEKPIEKFNYSASATTSSATTSTVSSTGASSTTSSSTRRSRIERLIFCFSLSISIIFASTT